MNKFFDNKSLKIVKITCYIYNYLTFLNKNIQLHHIFRFITFKSKKCFQNFFVKTFLLQRLNMIIILGKNLWAILKEKKNKKLYFI